MRCGTDSLCEWVSEEQRQKSYALVVADAVAALKAKNMKSINGRIRNKEADALKQGGTTVFEIVPAVN